MSLSSALNKSVQVKFFDMSVFFIVSLITFRYFEIDERGLLSIFWATFFIIELLIMEFGVTAQAKIPDQIIKKRKYKSSTNNFIYIPSKIIECTFDRHFCLCLFRANFYNCYPREY